jgi:hypothetical protein
MEVIYHLDRCPFRYPSNAEVDDIHGFGHIGVIPELFSYMAARGRFPAMDEMYRLLMEKHCDARYREDHRVMRRAQKLCLDFARDMHTKGLLDVCDLFGCVEYQKALDLGYNVDFVAGLASYLIFVGRKSVAVQAKMRAKWDGPDRWDGIKADRRRRRGGMVWKGRVYEITNRARRYAKNVAGVWLFGEEHVRDLAREIKADYQIDGDDDAEVAVIQPPLF